MNKDLRDLFASLRTGVSDALTPTKRLKFQDPSPFDSAQGQDFGSGLPLRSRPLNASNYQRAPAKIGLGSFGAILVDGHTSALTHRSIPLSPTSGYVSVTGITDVCDEKG